MDFKKILVGVFVFGLLISVIGLNSVSAKKASKAKMELEVIDAMAAQVDDLTKKVYAHALLSPQDNSNLVGIKIKLDNQMLLEPDPALAPLYYKVGCMYKLREMTNEATECFQTVLENFGDTALAPKSYQALKDMGVDVSQFGDLTKKTSGEEEEE
ncbi:MAG: hypothetical protein ACI4S3_05000 [Candidatus Gastranaerophilaceae bacterium]